MSSSNIAGQAEALRTAIDEVLATEATASVDDETVRTLMSAVVRLYSAKVDRDTDFPVVAPNAITATDAMIAATGLLRAVNVQLFELGLWQSWALKEVRG